MSVPRRTEGVRVRAPGKINVFFEVGPLQDDGYHAVASAYQAVSLFEEVWALPADDFRLDVSGTVDVSGVPVDDRNLALRAARMLAQHTGYDGGVHLAIDKRVPVAGGMGGGSADAAAALVACDALWGTDVGISQLHRLAARLGADVPFALMGGTAIGLGRGDRLSPALATGRFEWVVVVPESGLSTPAVYRELDRLRADANTAALGTSSSRSASSGHPSTGAIRIAPSFSGAGAPDDTDEPVVAIDVLHALRAGDAKGLAAQVHNDLQDAALSLQPGLRDLLQLGERSGALAGMVSGSGPTVAFLAADVEAALELQVTLSAAGHSALHVHGPVPGARVI